ncbi:unnamed protein product [Heterobilharzia americana]|nr:unnamed protein product [Heterobilharzia americana]
MPDSTSPKISASSYFIYIQQLDFTLLCHITLKNLYKLSQKSQTRLSYTLYRSLCNKCLIPLYLQGKMKVKRRHIHFYCSICKHKTIIKYENDYWYPNYIESILPDSYCNELYEKNI